MNEYGHYHSYLLRLWQVSKGGRLVWRISPENTHSHEQHGFPDLKALVKFLRTDLKNLNGSDKYSDKDKEGDLEGTE